MRSLLLFLIIATFSFSKIQDLGIDGHVYDIEEENLMKTIETAVKELSLTEEDIRRKINEEVIKQSKGTSTLPYTKEKREYVVKNYQILPEDIVNPLGRYYKRKGDKVLINSMKSLDICYVDGTNPIVLTNQINFFDKLVREKSGEYEECVYMVSNRSVLELNRKYYPRTFYPSKKAYEDVFMVKYIPTYIHIVGEKRYVYEYPIDMFKNEVK